MLPLSDGVPARRFPVVNVLLIVANLAVFILYELPHLNMAVYHASFCQPPGAERQEDNGGISPAMSTVIVRRMAGGQPSHRWYRVGTGMPVIV